MTLCLFQVNEDELDSTEMSISDPDPEPSAWAPTLLTAFDNSFFFETCRAKNGNW